MGGTDIITPQPRTGKFVNNMDMEEHNALSTEVAGLEQPLKALKIFFAEDLCT